MVKKNQGSTRPAGEEINPNLTDETKSFQERIDEVRSLVEENLRYTKALSHGSIDSESDEHQELRELLRENLKISQELYELTKKIRRWTVWQRVWGVVKILIIAVPILLGIIYLPPLLQKNVAPLQKFYQEISTFKLEIS